MNVPVFIDISIEEQVIYNDKNFDNLKNLTILGWRKASLLQEPWSWNICRTFRQRYWRRPPKDHWRLWQVFRRHGKCRKDRRSPQRHCFNVGHGDGRQVWWVDLGILREVDQSSRQFGNELYESLVVIVPIHQWKLNHEVSRLPRFGHFSWQNKTSRPCIHGYGYAEKSIHWLSSK